MARFLAARRQGLPLPAHRGQPRRRHPPARVGARRRRGGSQSARTATTGWRCSRKCAGWSTASGSAASSAARSPDPAGEVAPVALAAATTGGAPRLGVPAGRIAAGLLGGFRRGKPAGAVAGRSAAGTAAGGAGVRVGNEAIAGTYVGGRWRPTACRALARRARAAGHHRLPRQPAVPGWSGSALERLTSPQSVRAALGRARRRRTSAGAKVTGLRRLGKRIVLELDGDLFIVIHLMIAGRLRWRPPGAKPPGKIALAAFEFPTGTLVLTEAGTQAARVDPPRRAARRRCGRSIAAGSRCSTPTRRRSRRGSPREPHAQARAHRSAPVQRDRQRLLGRDPAPRPALAAGADAQACRRTRSRRLYEATRADAARMDRPAARRGGGGFPGEGDGVPRGDGGARPVSAAVPGLRHRRCSASATPPTRRTTAPAARPAAGCSPTARCRDCCGRTGPARSTISNERDPGAMLTASSTVPSAAPPDDRPLARLRPDRGGELRRLHPAHQHVRRRARRCPRISGSRSSSSASSSAAFAWAYAMFQFPGGVFGDVLGAPARRDDARRGLGRGQPHHRAVPARGAASTRRCCCRRWSAPAC